MTSGEWDLRALKALEAEEQAQFRTISESNLFKTPPPPPPPTIPSASSSSSSSQQPQIILPTINEHCGDLDDGLDVPPLPLALLRSDVAASTLSLKKKKKSPATADAQPISSFLLSSSSAKPSGSLTPPQFTASPIFTPPPIRRCATLSHSGGPAVRRHFRSLHQQILGKKSGGGGGGGSSGSASGALERRRSRSNYNCNYTSCAGGGGFGFGQSGSLSDNYDYDSTDSGSCTVPLTKDSIEMMRLMLFSATSTKSNSPEIPPSIASASSSLSATGGGCGGTNEKKPQRGAVSGGSSRAIKISSLIHDDSCSGDVIDDDSLTNGNCTSLLTGGGTKRQHQKKQQQQQQSRNRHKSFLSLTGCDGIGGGGRSGGSSSNSSATGGSIMGITCTIRKSPTKSLLMSGCSIDANALNASTLNVARGDDDSDMEVPPKGPLDDENARNIRTTNHFNDLVKSIQSTKSTLSTGSAPSIVAAAAGSRVEHQHPCTNVFDDELEHHIKHCSCSCNHMGYGNSMDYQVGDTIYMNMYTRS